MAHHAASCAAAAANPLGADDESEEEDDDDDPQPACAPPAWAQPLVADCRQRAGRAVYPPSDDTFLLLEALADDLPLLRELSPRLCLEIGSGTGAALAGLAMLLSAQEATGAVGSRAQPARPLLVATDKNPDAVACTRTTLARHGGSAPAVNMVVQSSFVSGMRLAGQVDVGLCNPPYVPTPPEEMLGCGIEVSWAGGDRGRQMIDQLLPQLPGLLSPRGVFYLVCVAENEPQDLLAAASQLGGPNARLEGTVARQERRGIEELFVLRFRLQPRR